MAQSPELAGGAGFTFEDAVAATYFISLLQEGFAPGIQDRIVCRMALQQRDFGEPLDDLIVDFRSEAGELARLSVQVKRSLTVSNAVTNTDFREIVRDCWGTLCKPNFRKGFDRYGAAVGQVASGTARDLRFLCEIARANATLADFEMRFAAEGNANAALRQIREDIASLIEAAAGAPCSSEELQDFLAHFVLIEFDFLHEGSTSRSNALNSLRTSLVSAAVGQTPALWDRLCRLTREGAGKSAVFDRPRLVRELSGTFRLTSAPSLRKDVEQLTNLTRQWLADIEDDVGGIRLERAELAAELNSKLAGARWVQIRGLPGSGKSVLLRRRVEVDLTGGPVLLLKSGRLEGKGWASFATANGLSTAPLTELLVEIAATGSNTLYVDGIDRIEKEQQAIVLDIIRTIMEQPLLDDWRVVVSLRDTGIEPLRNWLGQVLNKTSIATVEVSSLNDQEAELLAQAKPQLQVLLFGHKEVREIVRRPFFAKVLDQNFGSSAGDETFQPRSEVDLIGNWWVRGGYNSDGQSALERQRAIIELGSLRARHLERDISVRELTSTTLGVVDQFISDGILQHVKVGHSLRFSHDIFFEWAFFHVLLDRESAWLDEIRGCGEPPAVARVVELLSQWRSGQDAEWSKTLHQIVGSKMRTQWTRAWLLAPLSAPNFEQIEVGFGAQLDANDHHFLKKALVWFQAERTTPNPNILQGNLPQDERIRIADLLGWPSDFSTWARFISFVLARVATIPITLYPDIVSIFEVWQNSLADLKNPISDALLDLVAGWLKEIERDNASDQPPSTPSRWETLESDFGDFTQSLLRLILRSAVIRPDLATDYLSRIIAADHLRQQKFAEIIQFAPILAQSHAVLLVELSLKQLKKELPEDREARQQREFKQSIESRDRARAIPPEKRSRTQQMAAENQFLHLGTNSFNDHDWETLSVDRSTNTFFPASPRREPFNSLFASAPEQAIRLITELSNHAMKAWLQLHRLSPKRHGTPVPLDITFPWGKHQFWGGDREYLWCRGLWAPKALACGYLALEEWTFSGLERGLSLDELARRVVSSNECIAVLGVVISAALQAEAVSETIFPIVTSQRLLTADHNRMLQDLTSSSASLIGFDGKHDLVHIEAVKKINARSIRRLELSWLASLYFFDSAFKERLKATILNFVNDLPFQLNEHRSMTEVIDHLRTQALQYAELVDPENYKRVSAPEVEADGRIGIVHVSPTATSPDNQIRAIEAHKRLQEGNLWAWCSEYFESGQLGENFTLRTAIDFAKNVDDSELFVSSNEEDSTAMRRGAVAATAAVVLTLREMLDPAELVWARDVVERARSMPENQNTYWSSGSIIPWHPVIFAARGLAAEFRHGTANRQTARSILSLVAHPLEAASLAALEAILSQWVLNPRLGWSGLHLALSLCTIPARTKSRNPSDPIHTKNEVQSAIKEALRIYEKAKDWPNLPLPPAAWVRVIKPGSQEESWQDYEEEYDTSDIINSDEQWAPSPTHWQSQKVAKIFALVPIELVLKDSPASKFLKNLDGQLSWLISKLSPPWVKPGRRDRSQSNEFEWTHELGRTLGKAAGHCSLADFKVKFLDPIFALEGDNCWALLAPLVDIYICAQVYDAHTIPADAIPLLEHCLERLLKAPELKPSSYRAGELHGFDQPSLAKSLMFVSVERAALAARYVNGNWSDIQKILPVVDRYVRTTGWASTIMSHFLTLSERSKASYPAGVFAKQILEVIGGGAPLKGWHGTFLPARIAGLVQHFAHRETPMPLELGQDLLRILDLLVDMGDRRSAALQLSESFREIRIV